MSLHCTSSTKLIKLDLIVDTFFLQGYELLSFDSVPVSPPEDLTQEMPSKYTTKSDIKMLPSPTEITLTDEEARSALLSFVSAHCCYGTGAAKQMRITSMEYVPAHHYELQTFTERRETCWTYAPHKGEGQVDGPYMGPAPLPWEIEEKPLVMFKDYVRLVTVPHTEVVKTCHKCRGTGGTICSGCGGKVEGGMNNNEFNYFHRGGCVASIVMETCTCPMEGGVLIRTGEVYNQMKAQNLL